MSEDGTEPDYRFAGRYGSRTSTYRGRMDTARGRSVRTAALRWAPSASIGAVAVLHLASGGVDAATVAVAAILLVLAWVVSPWAFPRSQGDAAARASANTNNVPLIYWRPGCSYCLRLRIALGLAGNRAVWVDVSRDDRAAARVREVNGGNETVPTVFIGHSARVNPSPSWVRDQLRSG